MLAASTALLALLGVSFTMFVETNEDDAADEAGAGEDEPVGDLSGDETEVVGLDAFLESASSSDDAFAPEAEDELTEDQDVDTGDADQDLSPWSDVLPQDNVQDEEALHDDEGMDHEDEDIEAQQQAEEENSDADLTDDELPEEELPPNVVAGGPGDTLTGGPELDSFEVSVGSDGDPETIIENLFDTSGVPVDGDQTSAIPVETIWLKDDQGEYLSREDLLVSDLRVEEDAERGGVTISLNGHSTLYVDDINLDDFTENSLVLGNFQIFGDFEGPN
ncbi:MAG: hypothetical protein ABJL67_02320 [Sulfitobacter sp.]